MHGHLCRPAGEISTSTDQSVMVSRCMWHAYCIGFQDIGRLKTPTCRLYILPHMILLRGYLKNHKRNKDKLSMEINA